MKIGFTGTQSGMTEHQKIEFLDILTQINKDFSAITEFHHGDCIGADYEAHQIFRIFYNEKIHIHPSNNSSKRAYSSKNEIYYQRNSKYPVPDIHKAKPYLERNKVIVNETDMLIACPKSKQEELRSGTWATIRYAKKQKKPIIIIFPDGTTQKILE